MKRCGACEAKDKRIAELIRLLVAIDDWGLQGACDSADLEQRWAELQARLTSAIRVRPPMEPRDWDTEPPCGSQHEG